MQRHALLIANNLNRNLGGRFGWVLGFFMLACPVHAQQSSPPTTAPAPSHITFADRAGDAAVQQLIESVLAFELHPNLPVEAVIAGSIERELGMHRWIVKSNRLGLTQEQSDGAVEVDATIDMPALIEELGHIVGREIPVNASWPLVLSATGRCQPSDAPFSNVPGWRHCSKRKSDMAALAAIDGARAKLLRQLRQVRLERHLLLGQLFDEHPDFMQDMANRIQHLAIKGPFFDRAGICRCEILLTQTALIDLLSQASAAYPVRLGAAQAITLPENKPTLLVEAWSVSPLSPASTNTDGRPAWADTLRTTRATARIPTDIGDPDDRRERAVTAARIEACRLLWLEIEALPLPDTTTVGQRLRQDQAIRQALAEVDSLMFPVALPNFDENDNATITMGIQLDQVWRLLVPYRSEHK